jgi:hypothetical protein
LKKKTLQKKKKVLPLQPQSAEKGAISSAGSEHLPYKQGVGGSNPSSPTQNKRLSPFHETASCFFYFPIALPKENSLLIRWNGRKLCNK